MICILARRGRFLETILQDGAGSGVPRLRREPYRGRLGPRPPVVHGLARAVAAASCVPLAEGQRGSAAGKRHGGAPKGVPVAPGRSAPYRRGRRASHARQKEKRVRLSALHPPLVRGDVKGRTLPFTSRLIRAMDAGLPWDSRGVRPPNRAEPGFARRPCISPQLRIVPV